MNQWHPLPTEGKILMSMRNKTSLYTPDSIALEAVDTSRFQSRSSSTAGPAGSVGIEPVRPLVVGLTIATSWDTFLYQTSRNRDILQVSIQGAM